MHRHRVHRLHVPDPPGREADQTPRGPDHRADAVAVRDHDTGVAVVEPEPVVVAGDQQRPAEVHR